MDNLARKEDIDREIGPFMRKISWVSDPQQLNELCHEFLFRFPPQRGLEIASALTFANPFFMADIPEENARQLAVNLELFVEIIMRAKLTAARADQPNILVACAPKSASTFIQHALHTALALPTATLMAAAFDPGSVSALGGNLREQEPDELALLRNGLNKRGYVAQLHCRCSPFTARMIQTYNVRPIVTYRNLFDTIVSLDDMVQGWRGHQNNLDAAYFNDGLPSNFAALEREDRLMLLVQRHVSWLLQFYISWKKCERLGLVKPLWISYEQDLLGDKRILAQRVTDHLGIGGGAVMRLGTALEDRSNASAKRLNQGIAGRGQDMPQAVRDQILRMADFYRADEDLTPILGA